MDRRDFIKKSGSSLGLLAVQLNGLNFLLSPTEARAANVPLTVLTPAEAKTLESFGEVLLPGAKEAGLAHFIDHHLAVDAKDSLLMLRYMDWPAPYAGFYKAGLMGLDAASSAQHQKKFHELTSQKAEALVRSMGADTPSGWQGIPAQLFYFVVRSDAVDVVYGTEEGFEKLGVPYMAHITPPSKW